MDKERKQFHADLLQGIRDMKAGRAVRVTRFDVADHLDSPEIMPNSCVNRSKRAMQRISSKRSSRSSAPKSD